jgi:hypothetical protein
VLIYSGQPDSPTGRLFVRLGRVLTGNRNSRPDFSTEIPVLGCPASMWPENAGIGEKTQYYVNRRL